MCCISCALLYSCRSPEGAPAWCSVSQAVFSAPLSLSSPCVGTRQHFSKEPELVWFLFSTSHTEQVSCRSLQNLTLCACCGRSWIENKRIRSVPVSHGILSWEWVEVELQICIQINTLLQMVANALKGNCMPCNTSLSSKIKGLLHLSLQLCFCH